MLQEVGVGRGQSLDSTGSSSPPDSEGLSLPLSVVGAAVVVSVAVGETVVSLMISLSVSETVSVGTLLVDEGWVGSSVLVVLWAVEEGVGGVGSTGTSRSWNTFK